MADISTDAVKHDKNSQKFTLTHGGHVSELNYREVKEGVLEYFSTHTHPESRGLGIAGKITQAALEYAQQKKYKVIPTCWYVAEYLQKHPEFQNLKAE
jgi:uncharacterized protein